MTVDVLIVGAGPVGLALALDLGQRGIRSIIIERNPGTYAEIQAKASVIDERTMEYCRLLGIAGDVANSGYPNDLPGDTDFSTSFGGKHIGRLQMPSANNRPIPPESSEMMRRCPQLLFDPILATAVVAQGMTDFRYGVECIGCEQEKDQVTVFTKSCQGGDEVQSVQARYVVACDGPGSILRKTLGIPFDGQDLGYSTSAIVRIDLEPYDRFGRAERYVFISPEGVWANFTAIDGKKLWRFTILGVTERIDNDEFDIHPILRKALGDESAQYEVLRISQWRRSQCVADKYCQGRVFLAGDAAHVMSPTGGHGLNTGMGDARGLSWMLQGLIQGWGGQGLIEAYNAERRPIAIRNSTGSSRNFQVWKDRQGRDKVLDEGPEADQQRQELGAKLAIVAAQEFQALGMALGYSYANSPIIVPDGSSAPPDDPRTYIQTARPGHRAPHHWLEGGKSIIDHFGKGFLLLCLGTNMARDWELMDVSVKAGLPLEYLFLVDADVEQLYETRLVLVRPDGMVAWRGNSLPDDVHGLLDRVRGVTATNGSVPV